MWMQVDDDKCEALLALASEGDSTPVKYFIERVKHYRDCNTEVEQKFRAAAKEHYAHDGDLEVDPDACVSVGGDPGAYVQVWKWITNAEAGFDNEETGSEDLEWEPTIDPITDAVIRVDAKEGL